MMSQKPLSVLFLCQGNSCRSLMAEALMNAMAGTRFQAYSAGSQPKPAAHPLALALTDHLGYPREKLYPKHWSTFAEPGAPVMDMVFTLCDRTAGEPCPTWPGQPVTAVWSFPDPAQAAGDTEQVKSVFLDVFHQLRRRFELLLQLPVERLDRLSLQQALQEIHQSQSPACDGPDSTR